MRIAYYDESGDDGFPSYSSPVFTLSAIYLHYLQWRESFEAIRNFRRGLKDSFGIPVNLEVHTKHLLLNKNPYRGLAISDGDRLRIVDLFCDLIGGLDCRIVNVAIVKTRILSPHYRVLDTALTYSIQRIENDLNPARNPEERLLIITDAGRVAKMRSTARRIQRINFIPSRFEPTAYRQEIRSLIEDPLPKDSKESYFVQLADLTAFIVYLYAVFEKGVGAMHGRMPAAVTRAKVTEWMERMGPSLNTQAAADDRFGVKFHPGA